ncbi:36135_t:CDS:2, partial [Gigaspora margarita]
MVDFNSLVAHGGSKCLDEEWSEYVEIPQVRTNEIPSEWMKRIWKRLTSYTFEIRIAICFSCNQLVYTGQRKKNIGNYNHIEMERHWKFSCTGNKFCGNAIKKIKHAREIGKKIQAIKVIQQKWLEYFYRPNSMYAMELAQHYQLLLAVREKMRQ